MNARDQILSGVRQALKRGKLGEAASGAVIDRMTHPRRNVVPARAASLDAAGRVALFQRMATEVHATVDRVDGPAAVPGAVASYLASHNLPTDVTMVPDPALDAYPWQDRPLLTIRRGQAEETDAVGITGAVAGIAETGTLMLASGAATPATLHLMPDTHIAILRADQIVAAYEDGFDRLRDQLRGNGRMPLGQDWALPRAVTFVTGPSRTGDIEQRIQLGAHGPRRLHIIVVGEP